MQIDFKEYLQRYNYNRPHQGRGMECRTLYEVFKCGVKEIRIGEEIRVPEAA